MARTRRLDDMRGDVRDRADVVNAPRWSDARVNEYINQSIAALHSELTEIHGDEFFEKDATLTTTPGSSVVSLPNDFYKISDSGLWWRISGSEQMQIDKYNPTDANLPPSVAGWLASGPVFYRLRAFELRLVPQPTAAYTLQLFYIPFAARLTQDSDTMEGYDGWEEWICLDAAIKIATSEQNDASVMMGERAAVFDRIRRAANRDRAKPQKVQRVRYPRRTWWPTRWWAP